jgi:hypothetical protein
MTLSKLAGITILMSVEVDFKLKLIRREKKDGDFLLRKGAIH